MTMRSGAALARVVRRSAAGGEDRCELCDAPLPDEHRHMLDLHDDQLRCACRACALLFEREAAGRGHYRLVPQRRLRLEISEDTADLNGAVPVGMAFYVVQADGSILVRYPSPIGITTGVADSGTWQSLVTQWPQLSGLVPSVEALLINTARSSRDYWIVPIEDCYRLVAVIREHWTGMSGGREVWPAVSEFFARLGKPASGRITVGTG